MRRCAKMKLSFSRFLGFFLSNLLPAQRAKILSPGNKKVPPWEQTALKKRTASLGVVSGPLTTGRLPAVRRRVKGYEVLYKVKTAPMDVKTASMDVKTASMDDKPKAMIDVMKRYRHCLAGDITVY